MRASVPFFRAVCVGPLLLLAMLAVAPALSSDIGLEQEVRFATALQALQQGESHIADELLKEFEATAESEAERLFLAALRAAAASDFREFESAVHAAGQALAAGAMMRPWIEEEYIRVAASASLDRLRREVDERLKEVLARHYEARGGLERIHSLEQMTIEGRLKSGDSELPLRLYRKRPGFYRFDLETPGGTRIEASDGQNAWRIEPTDQGAEATHLSPEETRQMIEQTHFDDVLVRFEKTGENLVLKGVEQRDGVEVYRIDVAIPDGIRQVIYLDSSTFLEHRRIMWLQPAADPIEIVLEMGLMDGLPFAVRQTVVTSAGQVEYLFDSYDFKQALEPGLFDLSEVVGQAKPSE
jgi:hypothetical protein